jgi:hypothetical protein
MTGTAGVRSGNRRIQVAQEINEGTDDPQESARPLPRPSIGRRRLLKGAIATTGGAVAAAYTPPTFRRLGMPVALAVSGPPVPVQGTLGFWKDGGAGQKSLWNAAGDLDWTAWAQKLGLAPAGPANPFVKTDAFTSVFAPHADLVGLTMQDVLEGPKQATEAQKAARALVASYLDASLYGAAYAYSQAQLKTMWQEAVTTDTPAAFEALKTQLEATYN